MKKTAFVFIFCMLALAFNSQSQTAAPAEYFAGKWEILVVGTPQGDSKLVAELVRTDGKLSGNIVNPAEPTADKIQITSVEENGEKISMAFSTQGYDVTIDLAKVDDDNMKGNLMNMFDATAKRVK
jgi:hypothetical protein